MAARRRRTRKPARKAAEQEFISESEEILERMRQDLADIADGHAESSASDPELVNNLFRSAHSLKGLAGLFGFEPVHDLAHKLEDVLDALPLVRQAAVIGMPDDRMGQKVVAFVEPASPEASAETLDAACLASDLARFKRPRAYVFVDAIPRSASGKLLRRLLRDGAYDVLPDFDSTL